MFKNKKIISILIVLMLMIQLMPTNVFANNVSPDSVRHIVITVQNDPNLHFDEYDFDFNDFDHMKSQMDYLLANENCTVIGYYSDANYTKELNSNNMDDSTTTVYILVHYNGGIDQEHDTGLYIKALNSSGDFYNALYFTASGTISRTVGELKQEIQSAHPGTEVEGFYSSCDPITGQYTNPITDKVLVSDGVTKTIYVKFATANLTIKVYGKDNVELNTHVYTRIKGQEIDMTVLEESLAISYPSYKGLYTSFSNNIFSNKITQDSIVLTGDTTLYVSTDEEKYSEETDTITIHMANLHAEITFNEGDYVNVIKNKIKTLEDEGYIIYGAYNDENFTSKIYLDTLTDFSDKEIYLKCKTIQGNFYYDLLNSDEYEEKIEIRPYNKYESSSDRLNEYKTLLSKCNESPDMFTFNYYQDKNFTTPLTLEYMDRDTECVNVYILANYNQQVCNVTIDPNLPEGFTGATAETKQYYVGQTIELDDLSGLVQGYIFDGYYINNTKISSPYTVTGDVTITCKWTKDENATLYTLNCYYNGSSCITKKSYSSTINANDINSQLSSKYYIIYGFYYDEDYQNEIDDIENIKITSGSELSIYAKIKQIKYMINASTITLPLDGSKNLEELIKEFESKNTSNIDLTDYKYYTDAQGTQELTMDYINNYGNHVVPVYVLKSNNSYSLTLHANPPAGFTSEDSTKQYTEGTKITLTSPECDGYKFLGWYTSDNVKVESPYTMPSEDVDLYAKWEKVSETVTITYDAQGGNCSKANETIEKINNYGSISNIPTATKEGYTFKGWYTSPTGGTKLSTRSKIASDVTVYARYKVMKYPIIYVLNEGNNNTSNPNNFAYGKTVTLKDAKREGYYFNGWYDNASFAGTPITTINENKSQVLYAKWTKVTCQIPKIQSRTSTETGKITVTYSTSANAQGYEVQCSKTEDFAIIDKKISISKSTCVLSGLESGTKYYIRVRAKVKDSTGSYINSDWSPIKSVTVQ